MNTLVTQDSFRELQSRDVIPDAVRAYFQQRLYSRVHQLLLRALRLEERSNANFSKRKFAKRISKKPEQITRWLSYPGNMTLETICDLLLGFGYEINVDVASIVRKEEPKVVPIIIKKAAHDNRFEPMLDSKLAVESFGSNTRTVRRQFDLEKELTNA